MATQTSRYVPAFRGLIQDPAVVEEFDHLAAVLKGIIAGQAPGAAEAGIDTGLTIQATGLGPPGPTIPSLEPGIRWLTGPWLFGPDGNTSSGIVLRPPTITANQDNYAPLGIDTCIGLELDSDANRTITGIRIAARQRRLLTLLNRGNFSLSFPHNDTGSIAVNRFGFGASGDILTLPSGAAVWLSYDVGSEVWRTFAIPLVPFPNLPASIGGSVPTQIPTNWFGTKASGGAVTFIGIGQANPTTVSLGAAAANDNKTTGNYVQITGDGLNGRGAVDSDAVATVRLQQDPTITWELYTGPDLTACRIWIEVSSTTGSANSDTANGSVLAFRFSSVVDSANWYAVARDGVTQQTASMGAIAVSTYYKLKIRVSAGVAYFSVNGGAEISLTTNPPSSTTDLQWHVAIFGTVADTANKALSVGSAWITYGL